MVAPPDELRQRRFRPKATTGCVTCKKRRIKCGEEWPTCRRCVIGHRVCERSVQPPPRPVADKTSKVLQPCIQSPIVESYGPAEERRWLDFFQTVTLPSLAAYWDSDFWSNSLLQIAHAEAPIRSALLALGALHDGFLHAKTCDPLKIRQFSVHHYSNAITQLNDQIKNDSKSINMAYICSILFMCIELCLGNLKGVRTHFQGASNLLNFRGNENDDLHHEAGRFLKAWDFASEYTALTHYDSDALTEHDAYEKFIESYYSLFAEEVIEFSSLEEAKVLLLDIQKAQARLKRAVRGATPYGNLEHYQLDLKRRNMLWLDSFDSFYTHAKADERTLKDKNVATRLLVLHKVVSILIDTSLSSRETDYNAYLEDFQEAVHLAELTTSTDSGSHIKIHGFEQPFASALFTIAKKCRHSLTRHRALDLLKLLARNGFKGPSMLVQIAEIVITMEEGGLRTSPASMRETILCDPAILEPFNPESLLVHAVNPEPLDNQGKFRVTLEQFNYDMATNTTVTIVDPDAELAHNHCHQAAAHWLSADESQYHQMAH